MIVNSSRVLGPWKVSYAKLSTQKSSKKKKSLSPPPPSIILHLILLQVHTFFSMQALHFEQVLVRNVSKIHKDINRVNGKAIILHSKFVCYKLPLTHSYNC
jgi:hypothetical protein